MTASAGADPGGLRGFLDPVAAIGSQLDVDALALVARAAEAFAVAFACTRTGMTPTVRARVLVVA
jgi:hypothetical protein